jgi:predicted DNA-binding antitoxin AbrB/MazE fold protein
MVRQIEAIYENGLLRLLGPVGLKDGDKVTVTVSDSLSDAEVERINATLDQIASLAECRKDNGFSGEDHDKVLYGWEKRK